MVGPGFYFYLIYYKYGHPIQQYDTSVTKLRRWLQVDAGRATNRKRVFDAMSGMSHSKTVHRQIYLVCPYMGEPLSRGRGTLLYMAITLKPANGNAHLRIILSLCYLIICIIRTHKRRGFAPEILRSWFGPSSASKWSTVSTDVCGTGTFDQS